MSEIKLDQQEQNAAEISARFSAIATLVDKELKRTKGELSESANHIFAGMINETLAASTDFGVPLDFEEFFEDFMPALAKAPEKKTPLHETALNVVNSFYLDYWKAAKPEDYASACYEAIIKDGKPVAMPFPLAKALNTIYCAQTLKAMDFGVADSRAATDDEELDSIEDAQDKAFALKTYFEDNLQEKMRVQEVIDVQAKLMTGIMQKLGLVEAAVPPTQPKRPASIEKTRAPSFDHPSIRTKFPGM